MYIGCQASKKIRDSHIHIGDEAKKIGTVIILYKGQSLHR